MLTFVLTMDVEVESTTKTVISVQLKDSCPSEVNEGNRTSRFVTLHSLTEVDMIR